ncbi:MAG: S-layer homology domain-containing protein [Clostridiales bacterium]|jgi:hypothetical protein|nr:S-layer homology domain-containing protein [Eubacteriales bacterium]MDH7566497.1 S-layer homology domain-containing protein [Clostridiales bacterium]
MKKVLIIFVIAAMLAVQMLPCTVFADSADINTALNELNNLSDDLKATLLGKAWDYAVSEIGNGREVTNIEIFNKIKDSLEQTPCNITIGSKTYDNMWEAIFVDSSTPRDGQMQKSSLTVIIQKLLNNKEVVVDYYNSYKDYLNKPTIKSILNLPANATDGQVYKKLYGYKMPILTSSGSSFERYGDIVEKMANTLGVSESLINTYLGDVNQEVDALADKINSTMANNGLTFSDVQESLVIFGLYADPDGNAPTVSSTDPSGGATGIALSKTVTVTFSEPILKGANFTGISINNGITATRSIAGKVLTLVPSAGLAYDTTYTVTIPAGAVEDYAGNALAAAYTFSFTTRSSGGSSGGGGTGGGGSSGGGGTTTPAAPSAAQTQAQQRANEIIAILSSGSMDASAIAAIESRLEDIRSAIDQISDLNTAVSLVESIIDSIGDALASADMGEEAKEGILNTLNSMAERIMERVGTVTASSTLVEAKGNGGNPSGQFSIPAAGGHEKATRKLEMDPEASFAVVSRDIAANAGGNTAAAAAASVKKANIILSGETVNQIIGTKLDLILKTARDLNEKLEKAGTGGTVKSSLIIQSDIGQGIQYFSLNIPYDLLKKLQEKGVEVLKAETSVASVSLSPGAVQPAKNQAVSIEAQKLTTDEAEALAEDLAARNGMTAEQAALLKQKIDGNPVFELGVLEGGNPVGGFESSRVEVSVPYELKGKNPDIITAFHLSGKGTLDNEGGVYDPGAKKVIFTASQPGRYVIKANSVTFTDVGSGSWSKQYVESIAAKGIIQGVGDGRFAPADNLTRAQFAAIMTRMFKLADTGAAVSFSDVNADQWFYKDVMAAAKAGLISGRPDGTFGPDEKISRQDMAVIAARALAKLQGRKTPADAAKITAKYKDKDEIASYAQNAVALCTRLGITGGMPDGSFTPGEATTREQAAAIIYRILNLK